MQPIKESESKNKSLLNRAQTAELKKNHDEFSGPFIDQRAGEVFSEYLDSFVGQNIENEAIAITVADSITKSKGFDCKDVYIDNKGLQIHPELVTAMLTKYIVNQSVEDAQMLARITKRALRENNIMLVEPSAFINAISPDEQLPKIEDIDIKELLAKLIPEGEDASKYMPFGLDITLVDDMGINNCLIKVNDIKFTPEREIEVEYGTENVDHYMDYEIVAYARQIHSGSEVYVEIAENNGTLAEMNNESIMMFDGFEIHRVMENTPEFQKVNQEGVNYRNALNESMKTHLSTSSLRGHQ